MSYFITRKMFLTYYFELNVEEEEKLLKFLLLLENSNVSSIINKYIKKAKKKAKGPMWITIIYGLRFVKN